MAVIPQGVIIALGSAGLVGGVPAWKSAVGFADPLTFVAPNRWQLTLDSPIAADDGDIIVTGRNGFQVDTIRVSDTALEIQTYDGAGAGIGAFDIVVSRVPIIAPGVVPNADPTGVPFSPASDLFTPPMYIVSPTVPTPTGAFATFAAAQAAAVADGFGGLGNPQATIVVLTGDYTENVVPIPGIHFISWDQMRQAIPDGVPARARTRLQGVAGAAAVTFTPPAGGDYSDVYVCWNGIDVAGFAGQPAVRFNGVNAGGLNLANCNLSTVGANALDISNTGNTALSRVSEFNVKNFTNGGTAPIAQGGDCFLACESSSLEVSNPAVSFGYVITGGAARFDSCFIENHAVVQNAGVTFSDTEILGNAGGVVTCDVGSTVIMPSGRLLGVGNPQVSGAGSFTFGCIAVAPFAGDWSTVTTRAQLDVGQVVAGAVGVVWAATVPQTTQLAINRIAAAVAAGVPIAAPIP